MADRDSLNAASHEEMMVLLAEAERVANVGSWVWYPAQNRVVWTDQLYRILGIDPSETPSVEKYFSAIHPDDLTEHKAASERAVMTNDASRVHECRILHKDGTVLNVSVRGMAFKDSNGVIEKIVGTVADITQQKLDEKQRADDERLRSINTLTAGVSHDFNNFLQIIVTATEWIRQEESPSHLPKRIIKKIELIQAATQQCSNLVRRMIALSLTRQNHVENRTNVGAALKQIEEILKMVVDQNHPLSIEYEEDLFAEINPVEFNQIVLNLTKNARQALSSSGRVQLKAMLEELPGPISGDPGATGEAFSCIHLIVSDDGAGMTEEQRSRIFDPFYTTHSQSGGSGIGLPAVKEAVLKAKGSIEVESKVGAGTAFHVRLPQSTLPGTTEARDFAKEFPGDLMPESFEAEKQTRILYIEDNDPLRDLTHEILESQGLSVVTFPDALMALDYLKKNGIQEFDLVFTDNAMPGMTGIELLNWIWKQWPNMPALLTSGHGEILSAEALANSKAKKDPISFLSKPYTLGSLILHLKGIGILSKPNAA